ncbi:hypothetical protein GCM10023188_44210 [Pontibacter saemangeumensis]|uniref:Uncharacterized protein n=1 Tax=Pontibacter saemangeumensis TaxID=1084525 RepID=A0ABP8M4V8_9BACT
MTEGRATGSPTIKRALESNGSPASTFPTDEGRTFFEVGLFCHPAFLSDSLDSGDQVSDQIKELSAQLREEHLQVLAYVTKPAKRKKILEQGLGLTNHTKNVKRYNDPLLEWDLLDRTVKDRPNSPLQLYVIREKGRQLLHY